MTKKITFRQHHQQIDCFEQQNEFGLNLRNHGAQ